MISEGKDRARRDHYGVSRECRRRNYRYIYWTKKTWKGTSWQRIEKNSNSHIIGHSINSHSFRSLVQKE